MGGNRRFQSRTDGEEIVLNRGHAAAACGNMLENLQRIRSRVATVDQATEVARPDMTPVPGADAEPPELFQRIAGKPLRGRDAKEFARQRWPNSIGIEAPWSVGSGHVDNAPAEFVQFRLAIRRCGKEVSDLVHEF